jgi:hypothetical protein
MTKATKTQFWFMLKMVNNPMNQSSIAEWKHECTYDALYAAVYDVDRITSDHKLGYVWAIVGWTPCDGIISVMCYDNLGRFDPFKTAAMAVYGRMTIENVIVHQLPFLWADDSVMSTVDAITEIGANS